MSSDEESVHIEPMPKHRVKFTDMNDTLIEVTVRSKCPPLLTLQCATRPTSCTSWTRKSVLRSSG